MKKAVLFLFLFTISLTSSYAQREVRASRINAGVDLGTGFQDGSWAPSILYYQNLSAARYRWLQIGWGLRGWGYYSGATTLEAPDGSNGFDRLRVGRVSANGASFVLGFNLRLSFIDVGVNTDIFGIAFGKRRQGLYSIANVAAAPDSIVEEYHMTNLGTAPRNLNALPSVWKANNGQAEAYVRVRLGEQVGFKVGYTVGRVAYRTDVALNNRQSRFSNSFGMPYIALSMPLY
ncbi:hypothetical protein [Telluribacter sp. SYSU D00476]|uniref:hypothetical protein n=1 Tax=Telluribacter sp. SYSU D00476 TaxID=2811430 RepID=UPI001FF13192|nr:hypothetical protein [Telluribacter sp. SYSU D00476]